MKTFIYALSDPRNNCVRYVGKTCNPIGRLISHIKDRGINRKGRWISEISSLGIEPNIDILEELDAGEDWADAERFWISYWKFLGAKLTNGNKGRVLSRPKKQPILRKEEWEKIGVPVMHLIHCGNGVYSHSGIDFMR